MGIETGDNDMGLRRPVSGETCLSEWSRTGDIAIVNKVPSAVPQIRVSGWLGQVAHRMAERATIRCVASPVLTSHSATEQSSLHVAMYRPSGLIATPVIRFS